MNKSDTKLPIEIDIRNRTHDEQNGHLNSPKNAYAKVAVLVPLGLLFGSGAPGSDLGGFQVRV